MYTMDADGVVFHDLSQNDPTLAAMGTEATLELNKAGSLVFTLPPGNVAYNALKKRKSVVTLYQDGEMLFRGRVLETVTDLYNMQEVYCEGELTLLMDSIQEPVEYKGPASSYLRQMISNHNAQMDADKQFVVGDISALTDENTVDIETTEYRETLGEIRSLLVDEFGGYLRVRYEGNTRYLDYIKEYTGSSGQMIKFGVNLVDIENRVDTFKFCTVLLPLGKTVKGQKTTIAEVNGGSVYLEDAAAVAVYGRIIKPETFDNVEDPAELLEFAQKFMAQMKEMRGLTIKAVDLKNIDPDADGIRLGDRVTLDSSPHGLDESEICSKVVLPIDNPEQAEYTFGTPPETLTDNNAKVSQKVSQNGNELSKIRDWLTVTDEELKLQKQWISETGDIISNVLFEMDAMNATIRLKADQTVVDGLDTRISNAEILIDGANAAIDLKADRTEVTSLEFRLSEAEILIDGANAAIELKANQTAVDALTERISQAEIDIDGANAQISLKASQSYVDELGERVTNAELLIDGQNSKIEAKADLILLDGYVKTTELEANYVKTSELEANYVKTGDLESETLKVLESATIPSLKSGAFNCSGIATVSTLYVGTGAVIPSLVVGGEQLGSASLTMGPTTATLFAPSDINLSHSHAVTVNGDGTITLGEVATTGGSFKIADTKAYKDGVSAAKKEGQESVTLTFKGWTNGVATVEASNGKTETVSLPPFSVSGGDTFVSNKTTVYFTTASVNGYLASKTVDATSVYDAGYDAVEVQSINISGVNYLTSNKVYTFNATAVAANGATLQQSFGISVQSAYDAGYNAGYSAGQEAGGSTATIDIYNTTVGSDNKMTVYILDTSTGIILKAKTIDVSSTYDRGYQAACDGIEIINGSMSITNTQPNYMYASVRVTVNVDDVAIKSKTITGSQYFPGLGQG